MPFSGWVAIVFFIATCVFIIVALAHLLGVIRNIRPNRNLSANLWGPFSILAPGILTEAGKRHRALFAAFLFLAGLTFLFSSILGAFSHASAI